MKRKGQINGGQKSKRIQHTPKLDPGQLRALQNFQLPSPPPFQKAIQPLTLQFVSVIFQN
jgi:hypothetical protein